MFISNLGRGFFKLNFRGYVNQANSFLPAFLPSSIKPIPSFLPSFENGFKAVFGLYFIQLLSTNMDLIGAIVVMS